MGLIEQLHGLEKADSEKVWSDKLFALGHKLGFDSTLFAVVPRPGMALGNAFLRSNYAQKWRQFYDERSLALIDPTVGHCLAWTSPLIWSDTMYTSEEQKNMREEAQCYGLRSGVTLPIHGPQGELGMLTFATDELISPQLLRHFKATLPKMALIRDVAFDASCSYLRKHLGEELPDLTQREKEVLLWTARGKSAWEIAEIFHCSEAVVDFHLANVRRKFSVTSKYTAAIKALQLGLIDSI